MPYPNIPIINPLAIKIMQLKNQLFTEATNNWDLDKLYEAVDRVWRLAPPAPKGRSHTDKGLTQLEKTVLRGLLCGYSPQQIAAQFPTQPRKMMVNLVWRIHRCIEIITGNKGETVNSYQEIPQWLEAAGYKIIPPTPHQLTPISKTSATYQSPSLRVSESPSQSSVANLHENGITWDALPQVSDFYGRERELTILQQEINNQTRLVTIHGIVGIGKTSLAVKTVESVEDRFDCIIWRSLQQFPNPGALVADIVGTFSPVDRSDFQSNLTQLQQYLNAYRCLIVVDDWQLQTVDTEGDEEKYDCLLQTVAQTKHRSYWLIATTQKPQILSLIGGKQFCLELQGLDTEAAKTIFQRQRLQDESEWERLIRVYRGNPQELKLVANTIRSVFNGSVSAFFDQQTCLDVVVHKPFQQAIDRQFSTLSPLERDIIAILAQAREPLTRGQLQSQFHSQVYASELTGAIASLGARSLLEIIPISKTSATHQSPCLRVSASPCQSSVADLHENGITTESGTVLFTLQPLVMKHVIREYLPAEPPVTTPEPLATSNGGYSPSVAIKPSASPLPLPRLNEQDLLPPISRWAKLGGWCLAGAISIGIGLAAVTPYNVTVKANAQIRPAGKLKIVEAETEGSVIDIKVKENQPVKKGDILATVDNSHHHTRRSQLQTSIQQTQQQLKQVEAQINAQENRIVAETERHQRAVDAAIAELSFRQRQHQQQQQTTQAAVSEAQADLAQAQAQLQQSQTQLVSIQADLAAAKASLATARNRLQRYQTIAESGAIARNQVEDAQLDVEQKQQAVNVQKARIIQQQKLIQQHQSAIAAAEARLKQSIAALNPSDAEIAIAKEQIAQEKALAKSSLANLQREKQTIVQQQLELEKQLQQDQSELAQVDKDISQTAVKAPADGTVFELNLRNVGQTINPGEAIAQIVPSNNPLEIKAQVAKSDISRVKAQQKAQIRVSACPYPDYGVLGGKVSSISPDVITVTGDNSSSFYEVTIQPDSLTLSQGSKTCDLQLGMEGRTDIITKEETALRFLLRKARLIVDL